MLRLAGGSLALDEVRGFLSLRSRRNKQPRIRLEPCNPGLEIGGRVFESLLLDSRDAAEHGGGHLRDELFFRVGFRAKGSRVVEVLPVQTLRVPRAVG